MSFDCGDLEVAPVWRETKRRARKEHQCSACGETIRRGDFYVSHWWGGRDGFDGCKRCMRCDAIYSHLVAITDFEDQPMPRLDCGHEYKEVHGQEPPPEIAALAFALPGEVK